MQSEYQILYSVDCLFADEQAQHITNSQAVLSLVQRWDTKRQTNASTLGLPLAMGLSAQPPKNVHVGFVLLVFVMASN